MHTEIKLAKVTEKKKTKQPQKMFHALAMQVHDRANTLN